jgi:hypothetical protein
LVAADADLAVADAHDVFGAEASLQGFKLGREQTGGFWCQM